MDELSLLTSPLALSDDSMTNKVEVMQEVESLSLFEQLPSELFWEIIEHVPEALFNIRLTSQVLKSRVEEYTQQAVNIPLLKTLELNGGKNGTLDIRMHIPRNVRSLFRLFLKLRSHKVDLTERISELVTSEEYDEQDWCMMEFNGQTDHLSTLQFLGNSIGRPISNVKFIECSKQSTLMEIATLLEGNEFKKLEVEIDNLSNDVANHLLSTVNNHGVDDLMLTVTKVTTSDPVNMLHNLSLHLRSIYISQREINGIDPNISHYFFGVHDVEWAPIFLDMLSKELCTLLIDNRASSGYLDLRNAEILRKRLPLLKPIRFAATCNAYPDGLNEMSNEFSIRAEGTDWLLRYLRIAHSSVI